MGYYENKIKACSDIKEMLVDKVDIETICFKIECRYGLSAKFVNEFIDRFLRQTKKDKKTKEKIREIKDDKPEIKEIKSGAELDAELNNLISGEPIK